MRARILRSLSSAFAAAAAQALALAAAAAAAEPRVNFARATLPNGLEVVVEERRDQPLVAVRVYVKTGSIYEDQFLGAGISHFYEHLLSGGTTTTRTEEETAKVLRSIGAATNAYTTYDVTCYHITTTGEHYGTALDLLADWMINNTLDPREVAREREVVQRELEKDEDEPRRAIWRLYAETAYREHPVRVPIIGYKENIRRLTRDDLVAFYRDRYVPNNAVVAVVGDVSKEEALERVGQAFAGWERRPLPPIPLPDEPRQVAPRFAEKEMGVQVSIAKVGWPTVDLFDPDLYALDALAFVLGEGESSRLRRTLVQERRLANEVSVSSWTPSFARGQFTIQIEVEEHGKLDEAIATALAEVARLRSEPVSLEELERARRQKIAEHVFHTQSAEDRAEDLALNLIATGDPFFMDRYVARIQEQTPDDLLRVARRYFSDERLNVAIVKPRGAPASRIGQAVAPRPEREPAPGPTAIERIVLENGLTLLVRPMRGTRAVAIAALFRGGVRAETPETNGLFWVTAHAMARATKRRGPDELAAAVDALGGTIEPEAGTFAFGVRAAFLAGDAEKGLALVREVLREPSFPPHVVEREKWNAKYEIAAANDDWVQEGIHFLRAAAFGAHPYALKPFGTPESVDRLDAAALAAAHARYVVPSNGAIALFGDIDAREAERMLRAQFADWKGGPPPEPPPAAALPPAWPEADREVVKETEKGQTTIVIGWPGVAVESADRFALDVIDAITSGIGLPSGWLHDALRGGKRSLVYFVHAINWMQVDAGLYYVITRANPEDEKAVLDIIRDVQRRIVEEPVAPDELARGKAIATSAFQIGLATPAEQASAVALFELQGLGHDFADRYPERIRAVTAEDVARVARRIFSRPRVLALVRPKKAQ